MRLPALIGYQLYFLLLMPLCSTCLAQAALIDPDDGALVLVAEDSVELLNIDGLAFDVGGNLFGALEIDGAGGGLVHIDKANGVVNSLLVGIPNADQLAFHPTGDLYLTSEVQPAALTNRVYRVTLTYDASGDPVSAVAAPLITSLALDSPEGLAVLDQTSPYGPAGDLFVAEDVTSGRLLHVTLSGHSSVLVDTSEALARPEGLAFGDFGGALPPALYVAETKNDRIVRVDADGSISVFGEPAAIALVAPDNVEFGWDGFLYVSEGRRSGRVIRIDADGNHTVVADGFYHPQGLSFDPQTGYLYISDQDLAKIYRIEWSNGYRAKYPSLALYDDRLSSLPDNQSWLSYASDAVLAGGNATLELVPAGVEAVTDSAVSAGFGNYIPNPFDLSSSALKNPAFPLLDRNTGFELRFQLRISAESHLNNNRAGFSITLLSEDLVGIELGFWADEIWAQSGSSFTHAEGIGFDATAAEVSYRLAVAGNSYYLYADGAEILSGTLRNYSSFGAPYNLPNFLFMGDNTSSAGADATLGKVSMWTETGSVLSGPVTVIVDNQGSSTTRTGTWLRSSGVNPFNGESLYSDQSGTFRWKPELLTSGSYEVYAWWTYHKNRSDSVPYRIAHDAGTATIIVNQHDSTLGGQWVMLGTYNFTAGGSDYVEVSSENGQASADAIKLVPVSPLSGADLSLSMSDIADPVVVGDPIGYQLLINNDGPELAESVALTNELPDNVAFISAVPSQGSCSESAGVINCELGNVQAGSDVTVVITVTSTLAGDLSNSASVAAITSDATTNNNSASENTVVTESTPPVPVSDIIIDDLEDNTTRTGSWALSSGNNPYAGQSVYNNGDNSFRWTPVVIESGVYQVSVWWTYHSNRSTTVPYRISANDGIDIVIVNQRDSALGGRWIPLGEFYFVAGGAGYIEVSSENGQASADAVKLSYLQPGLGANLAISQTDEADPVLAGDEITYTLMVTNNGVEQALDTTVTDILPGGVIFSSGISSQGSCSESAGTVTCNLGDLTAGELVSVTLTVLTTATGTLTNNATVSSLTVDPAMADNAVSETTVVLEPNPQSEFILDNLSANTSRTGTWKLSSGANPYDGQSLYNNSNNRFRWSPVLDSDGSYAVYAWWTYHPNRSGNVPYYITHEGGTGTVIVNQQDPSLGGEWVFLGVYNFAAGSSNHIEVSSENGQASADAVRLVAQ